jgi:hypothetical protein
VNLCSRHLLLSIRLNRGRGCPLTG